MNKNISNSNSSPLPTGEGQGVRLEAIRSVYFVGAGGIGMSALIRYFLSKGKTVAGYDRTSSELTERLITEGAQIHYEEDIDLIPEECKDKASTLVVYTPAVPQGHAELTYFRENGFNIHKRSQVLGIITRSSKGLCVAGTHGKTTTSTMAAHLLHQSHVAAPPSSEAFRRTTVRICCFPPPALIPLSKRMSSTAPSTGYRPG